LVGWFVVYKKQAGVQETTSGPVQSISNFDECVAAGNPVMESYPEQCTANGQTFTNEAQQEHNNGWNTKFVSGNQGFETVLPDGFGPVIKPLDSDALYVTGTAQPGLEIGTPTEIQESDGYGTDSPGLFSIVILPEATDTPRGRLQPYTLVNGKENSIQGKKYTYIYPEDSLEGMGHQRFEGDRDYTYTFTLADGRQLLVTYSVYGSDPRNNLVTIENIIDHIKIL
jgi:hypothetical protein